MKRILLCIMALLLIAGTSWAQKGLNCYPVFRGKVVPAKRMVVTEVRGESMATYKLDYYHSVQFQVDEATAMKVAELILADADAADADPDADAADEAAAVADAVTVATEAAFCSA